MKLNYRQNDLFRALDIWPNLYGFGSKQVIPVETWTVTGGLGVVFFAATTTTRAEIMRELRLRYRRLDLLGARLFDNKSTVLFLKRGNTFPRRPTRAEVTNGTA